MKQGVLENGRVRLLMREGMKGYRPRKKGERKRKSIRGCIYGPDLSVINLTVVKKGDGELPGITDKYVPRKLGPKRATKIRKLFNLSKEDDVRKYVIRRELPPKEKNGKVYKRSVAPKIQRLITPEVLHNRKRMAIKRSQQKAKSAEERQEYEKLLAQRRHEQKEKRDALVAKRRASSKKDAAPVVAKDAKAPAKGGKAAPVKGAGAKAAAAPAKGAKPAAPSKDAKAVAPAADKGAKAAAKPAASPATAKAAPAKPAVAAKPAAKAEAKPAAAKAEAKPAAKAAAKPAPAAKKAAAKK